MIFLALFVISTRVFLLRSFDVVGHNWDWTFPAVPALFQNMDNVTSFTWARLDLGTPSFLRIVHTIPTLAFGLFNVLLPIKWTIFTVLLIVCAVSFFGCKRLVDALTGPSPRNAVPALLYAFSPFLFADIIGGSWVMWLSYAFLPLYFLWTTRYLSSGNWRALVASALLSVPVQASTQYFVVIHGIIALFLLALVAGRSVRLPVTTRRYGLLILITVLLSAYWVVGYPSAWSSSVQPLLQNADREASLVPVSTTTQTVLRIFDLSGYLNRNLYWFALPIWLRAPYLAAVAGGWLLLIIYLIRERTSRLRPALFWFVALFLLMFIVKGGTAPLGDATVAFFRAVPAMALFRSPQHLMVVPAFILPILLAYALQFLARSGVRPRLTSALPALLVALWISGWWVTGDFGADRLRAQRRDAVDFYRLPEDAARVFAQSEAKPLEHRTLFLPTVYSPFFQENLYQDTAQGGIPEYPYLRHPTLTAEGNFIADLVDAALCNGQEPPWQSLLPLLNVGLVVTRSDVLPWHTACKDRWDPTYVDRVLRSTPALKFLSTGPTMTTFAVRPESFLPLVYAASGFHEVQGVSKSALFGNLPTVNNERHHALLTDETGAALPSAMRARTALSLPGARVDTKEPVVRLPISSLDQERTFVLHRTLTADQLLTVRYNAEARAVQLRLPEDRVAVNGKPIEETVLLELPASEGDVFTIGNVVLTVSPDMSETVPFSPEVVIARGEDVIFRDTFDQGRLPTDALFNCSSGETAGPDISAAFPLVGPDGSPALELHSTTRDTACFRRAYDLRLDAGETYIFSLNYRRLRGPGAQIYFNVQTPGTSNKEEYPSAVLAGDDQGWQRYTTVFRPSTAAELDQLYLYTHGTDGGDSKNWYDTVAITRLRDVRRYNLYEQSPRLTGQRSLPTAVAYPETPVSSDMQVRPRDPLSGENLMQDGSFEHDTWNNTPADCRTGKPPTADVWLTWSTDATDGRRSLELGANRGHTACDYQTFSVPLKRDRLYKLSFDYKTTRGGVAQFSYHARGKKVHSFTDSVRSTSREWQTYETIVQTTEDTNTFQLFFYAPARDIGVAVTRYDHVRLVEWGPQSLTDYTLVSAPLTETVPPANVSFRFINPTRYRIRVFGASDSFPLVFSEAFNRGWKAYVLPWQVPPPSKLLRSAAAQGLVYNPSQRDTFVSSPLQGTLQDDTLPRGRPWDTWFRSPLPETDHMLVNGFANAWFINPTRICRTGPNRCRVNPDGTWDLDLIIDFWPQRLTTVGLGISALTLLGLLGSLFRFRGAVRRRGP